MTLGASMVRLAAQHGFGVRLTASGGLSLVPPVPGELPPDEVMAWFKANREALVEHLKAGEPDRCEECQQWVWAAGPEVGSACANDGKPEFETEGISETFQAKFIRVRPLCPWKRAA